MRRGRRIALVLAASLFAAGCSLFVDLDPLQESSASPNDAAPEADGGATDAGANDAAIDATSIAMCDPNAPFQAITPLDAPNVTLFRATLTDDERDAWFATYFSKDGGNAEQALYGAERANADASLVLDAATVRTVNAGIVTDPTITPDGLRLIYTLYNGPVGSYDLMTTTRTDRAASFPSGVVVTGVNSATADVAPFFASDGALWFSSGRDGAYQIYRAPAAGTAFDPPAVVPELVADSGLSSIGIALTHDLLTAYVSTDTSSNGTDIFVAHRASTSAAFGAPVLAAELSSSDDDRADWISTDNCRLYIESKRVIGDYRIYVASKVPPK
ncbi:MAG TPA: hypothetical protein VF407_03490 [Polyangiaceae bacterium]